MTLPSPFYRFIIGRVEKLGVVPVHPLSNPLYPAVSRFPSSLAEASGMAPRSTNLEKAGTLAQTFRMSSAQRRVPPRNPSPFCGSRPHNAAASYVFKSTDMTSMAVSRED